MKWSKVFICSINAGIFIILIGAYQELLELYNIDSVEPEGHGALVGYPLISAQLPKEVDVRVRCLAVPLCLSRTQVRT